MYSVEFHKRARKALQSIPKSRAIQIIAAIDELSRFDNPMAHPNVSPMKGDWKEWNVWRLRVGTYRVIFRTTLAGEIELLEVIDIGSRGQIYG